MLFIFFSKKHGGNANVGVQVSVEVGANVGANVGVEVGANVGVEVRLEVGANVGAKVGANVGANVGCISFFAPDPDLHIPSAQYSLEEQSKLSLQYGP